MAGNTDIAISKDFDTISAQCPIYRKIFNTKVDTWEKNQAGVSFPFFFSAILLRNVTSGKKN
jgi:hypothetical protein